ncbi:hypothetical protein RHGRI_027900 [Rhododendron griersonianum]|uniref:Mitochondrial carrier protein n=1 Tax=Rhododendron griersonianum TaxID=479676 RepID=A0AAV6J0B8_9ERIC|nr:hypothetical protein RHGRI_027900 [Rhododendron griersonianum]
MVEESEHTQNPWVIVEQCSGVEIIDTVSSITASVRREGIEGSNPEPHSSSKTTSGGQLGLLERGFSAASAAVFSAILVNPLDVVKTRLQAQAAGVPHTHPLSNLTSCMALFGPNMMFIQMFADLRCSPSCSHAGIHGTVSICPPDCFRYKGTLDVFYKIIRQEGFVRLWRGTTAGLALAMPTVSSLVTSGPDLLPTLTENLAFKEVHRGKKLPGIWKTLLEVVSHVKSSRQNYHALWTGLGAQLARDVPFSAIFLQIIGQIRRRLLSLTGEEANAATVLGANFSAGFVAGSLASAATCLLDVGKPRRQIEKDPARALRMTTRQTLMEVWRGGGMKGLFTGVGPRVGPSVGIVVSFYEVVKYVTAKATNISTYAIPWSIAAPATISNSSQFIFSA